MAGFNELIKNYDKIRGYIREFLLHGYKYRNDFTGRSARSYDNERRRIENYLSGYIHQENTSKGRRFCISYGSIDLESNPLFATWQCKSFTKNDIMLHFVLLDILMDGEALSVNGISDRIDSDYLSVFESPRMPDRMTIRNKLKEYVEIGILCEQKQGRQSVFSIQGLLNLNDRHIGKDLETALRFFQNVLPTGVLGHMYRPYIEEDAYGNLFSFRHQYFSQVLDDDILLQIFEAIREKRYIHIIVMTGEGNESLLKMKVLPVAVLNNIYTGRRYVVGYTFKGNACESFRLDKLLKATKDEICYGYREYAAIVQYHLTKVWGVSVNRDRPLETAVMVIRAGEEEGFILDRIRREGRQGILTDLGDQRYRYEIEVSDAWEAIPWFRTFIGRVESFTCSNAALERRFWKDVHSMANMYREEA